MIELIKKLYDWENTPSAVKKGEAAENVESLDTLDTLENYDKFENLSDSEFIAKMEAKEKVDFFTRLFRQIEEVKAQDKKIPFKIFYLNEDVLVVKVKGLYARLPLQQMAWSYPDMEYWKLVFPTLMGVEFKCKITEALAPEEAGNRFEIAVDASMHIFHPSELMEGAEYEGIVLQRTEDELLIDIGVQFRWKHGSLCGHLSLEELGSPETFQSCQPGDKITIEYRGSDERGLLFAAVQSIDPVEEYVGKTTWVQIGKGDGTAPYYMVEGKYKGDLPITKTHYPTKKRKLQKLRNTWENGDIIQCEIMEYKPHRGFIIKWIDDEPDELDWKSEEMTAYVGQKVPVYVYWTDEDELRFLVENQFPATLSGRDRSSRKEHLLDGQVITALIRSIDLEQKCFKIRWVPWWDKGSLDGNDIDNEDNSDNE